MKAWEPGLPPVLRDMLKSQVSLGRSGKRISTISLSTVNNLAVLRALHMARKPTRTLEVGLCQGGSGLVFTQSHKDLGNAPSGQHVAIDPFQRSHWIDEGGLCNIERAGLTGYLDFREDRSCIALPHLVADGAKFGLIYIDGSHLFEDAFVDFYYSAQLIEEGGLILFDDCALDQVGKVVRFVRRNMARSFKEFNLEPYRPAKGRLADIRYKAARLVNHSQLIAFERVGQPLRDWDSPFRRF